MAAAAAATAAVAAVRLARRRWLGAQIKPHLRPGERGGGGGRTLGEPAGLGLQSRLCEKTVRHMKNERRGRQRVPGCLYLPLRTQNGTAQRKTFRDRGPGRGSGQPAEASKARETAGKNPSGVGFFGREVGGGQRGAVLTNESRRRRPSSRRTAPRRRVVNGPALASRARSTQSAKPRRPARGAGGCPLQRPAHPPQRPPPDPSAGHSTTADR